MELPQALANYIANLLSLGFMVNKRITAWLQPKVDLKIFLIKHSRANFFWVARSLF